MNITPLLHKILSACSVSSIARDVQRSASGVVDKVDARANRQEKVEVVEVPIARQPVYRRVPFPQPPVSCPARQLAHQR